ncbi:hypothetical protein [Acinetobacter haemolyticus]|uniref:hypothetical protein n=1 Tax=Acinetobacter haemolyticus TaxID=29430 RepID=UPI001372FA38|nr:hypothetical protein [Acinetobacter haemolyticus]NAR91489.1 hypothetical protein [Acinetobacter haemolyticus]
MNIKKLLSAIHSDLSLDSAEEIKSNIELIARVQEMSGGERETIMAAFKHGPLYDGDVPSKSSRDVLVKDGFIAKVVVKGEDGFNACTYKGRWAYRILSAMNENSK